MDGGALIGAHADQRETGTQIEGRTEGSLARFANRKEMVPERTEDHGSRI